MLTRLYEPRKAEGLLHGDDRGVPVVASQDMVVSDGESSVDPLLLSYLRES